jgi:hypothetical protein
MSARNIKAMPGRNGDATKRAALLARLGEVLGISDYERLRLCGPKLSTTANTTVANTRPPTVVASWRFHRSFVYSQRVRLSQSVCCRTE